MYAALGLGLVLVHRASGVVNFAHGAMAMLVTYAFVELRPDLGLWLALAVSVVAAAALGLVVHVLVFRPLRTAPALARVVASVGLLATLQALAVLWFGAESRPVPSLLPNRPVAVLGVDVPRDRLLLAGLVVLAGVGPVGALPLHPLRPGQPGHGRGPDGVGHARLVAGHGLGRQLGAWPACWPAWAASSSAP